ncbi:MAG: DUF3828 domain-containing protein [bacterium]|nr:DUF3828 domain-containing protein [bacterium]
MQTWQKYGLTAAILAATLSSASAAGETPTQVVNDFYTMVTTDAKRYPSADKYPQLSKELRDLFAEVNQYPFPYCMDCDPWGGAQVGIDKFAVVSGSSRDDSAELQVKVHRYGCQGPDSYVMVKVFLLKEAGDWKITNFVVPKEQIDLRVILKEKIVEYAEEKNKGNQP